jgi:hypothetical protein
MFIYKQTEYNAIYTPTHDPRKHIPHKLCMPLASAIDEAPTGKRTKRPSRHEPKKYHHINALRADEIPYKK